MGPVVLQWNTIHSEFCIFQFVSCEWAVADMLTGTDSYGGFLWAQNML